MSWDKNRWEKLRRDGWVDVFRESDRRASKGTIYKTSFKAKSLITRIYKVLLGEGDLPWGSRSVFNKNKSYTDKVYNKAIDDMIKDNNR
jgi:hypothetical protein